MGRPRSKYRETAETKQCAWCQGEMRPRDRETEYDWNRRGTCSPRCRQSLGGFRRRQREAPPQLLDREWLQREYVGKKRATPSIAAEVGCSAGTVITALSRFAIPMRTQSQERQKHLVFQMTEEWLRREYVEKGRSSEHIAAEVGCTGATVRNTLHRFGLPVRDGADERIAALLRSNTRRKRPTVARKLGNAQRRQVRHLNSSCAWCETTDELEIHHRDADRSNDNIKNLVVLCRDCHAVAEWFIRPVELRLRAFQEMARSHAPISAGAMAEKSEQGGS